MATPNQHPPSKFRTVTKRRGEDEVQNKSSPGLVMVFGGKITLFYPLACEKHWWGTTCAQSQPGPGAAAMLTRGQRAGGRAHTHAPHGHAQEKRELRVWEGVS